MRSVPSSFLALLAGICFVTPSLKGAQSDLTDTEGPIRTWQKSDGLLSDSVTAIMQTRDGFLWVGTSEGLARFDGAKFTDVKLPGCSTNAPAWITALSEDSQGHVWIGTQQDGLFELDRGQVRHYTHARELLDDNVTSLAADERGFVWIGTKSGLNVSRGQEFKSFTDADGLPDRLVSGLHVARSGTVWITTRAGMCCYTNGSIAPFPIRTESQGRSPEYLGAYEDRRGNQWAFGDTYLINLAEGKRFNYFRGNEATSVRIWSLCEGKDGKLWIGTSGRGLFCFDDNRFQPVILGDLRWPYDVRAICEDREGNLWLGTSGGGLVQLQPRPVRVLKTGHGLPPSAPTALALDAAGRVYVGLLRGGLFVGDGERFERIGGGAQSVQNFVSSVLVAGDGTVWAGTIGSGLFAWNKDRIVKFTTANGLGDDSVLSVCGDRAGHIWASTKAGTLHRFTADSVTRLDTANGLPESPVTAMFPAADGGLWLGTENGAVLRGRDMDFTGVVLPSALRKRPILSICDGASGRLWVGSAGGGLLCMAKGRNSIWNTGNGLPNDVVAAIVEDLATNLWLATGSGIYRINRDAVEKSLSDPEIPLVCKLIADAKTSIDASATFGGARALLAPEGKLWFATSDGVLNIDARRPENESLPLPLYIENATYNAREAFSLLRASGWATPPPAGASLTAPVDLRSFEISFTTPSFTSADKIRFRHKLEGSDVDWVEDNLRYARYGRLSYGNYRFRVAAHSGDGQWQEAPESFAFVVPTPLYYQNWAIALYVLAATGLVAGIVRVVSHRRLRLRLAQLEQQQSLERERMRIARDMHDEMGSKLTKISFLSEHACIDAKSDGALSRKIASIAETSRELLKTMDEIVWVVNPRNDSLEHLTAYLSHYADEYFQNTSVNCELHLPQAVSHVPVSSDTRHNLFLAFEEALNNVLKHSGASEVKVEMAVNAPKFEVIVTDNGHGFESSGATLNGHSANGVRRGGDGLRNMRQRLADVGGECVIQSRVGAGTTVRLGIRMGKGQGEGIRNST